jgi:hypothetical protein
MAQLHKTDAGLSKRPAREARRIERRTAGGSGVIPEPKS